MTWIKAHSFLLFAMAVFYFNNIFLLLITIKPQLVDICVPSVVCSVVFLTGHIVKQSIGMWITYVTTPKTCVTMQTRNYATLSQTFHTLCATLSHTHTHTIVIIWGFFSPFFHSTKRFTKVQWFHFLIRLVWTKMFGWKTET